MRGVEIRDDYVCFSIWTVELSPAGMIFFPDSNIVYDIVYDVVYDIVYELAYDIVCDVKMVHIKFHLFYRILCVWWPHMHSIRVLGAF
jgi:hypothetical protein